MERILAALLKAFGSLLHPKMLWLMVWPVVVALVLWVTLAALYWSEAARWIDFQMHQWAFFEWAISIWPMTLIAAWFGWLLLVLLFVPAVLITAVLIISIVSMPAMVAHVGERDYPRLARRKGGTVLGSVWNAVAALVVLAVLFALSLPLWLIPLLWPVLPVALFGYFNQRVFRYDALAEHASADEFAQIMRTSRGDLFLLGIVLSALLYVPFANLLVPVLSGLAFTHYCLARLARLREKGVTGDR